jgi:NAD-dependent SIR2 family protein deacetylase
MSKMVFILGAGASREAGCPVMADFLEIADKIRYTTLFPTLAEPSNERYSTAFSEVFSARSQLQSVHSKARLDLHNIESVFGAFEMAKRFRKGFGTLKFEDIQHLSDSMRRLIVRTLELTTKFAYSNGNLFAPSNYGEFARVVENARERTSVSIITFNYDVGLDTALTLRGIPIDYCLKEQLDPTRYLSVIKLHGSINWAWCNQCEEMATWDLGDFCKIYPPEQYVNLGPYFIGKDGYLRMQIGSFIQGLQHKCRVTIEPDIPAIVPPTWEKREYSEGFENMWAHAANHLSEAETIMVIGYSLPPTDEFFKTLYALGTVGESILKRFWVFDPDKTGLVEKRFKRMLGEAARQKFTLHRNTFSECLEGLQSVVREL